LIDEPSLQGALRVLHSAPQALHGAVYRARKAESMLKHIKSLEMKRFNQLAVSGQEREAYASDAYKAALEEDAQAAAELTVLRSKIDAAKTVVDVWRTESATERASYG
jgi:hypothetical protein